MQHNVCYCFLGLFSSVADLFKQHRNTFAFLADLSMLKCREGVAHEDLTLLLYLCSFNDSRQLLLI